jgi:nitrous oxide reductase accessory protein NosL
MTRLASLVLLASALLAGCGADSSAPPQPTRVGAVEVVDLAGLEAKLAAHRGRGLLVNLWAMW